MNYYVYILTNKTNKVLYTGITNNLKRRIYEHKNGLADGFTKNIMFINWFILIIQLMCVQQFCEKNKSKVGQERKRTHL